MSRRWLERAEWALIPLGVVAYLVMPHGIGAGDSLPRYWTLDALMSGHLTDTRYSIVQALLAVPFHLIGQTIDYPRGVVALFNTSVLFAGLAAIALLSYSSIPAVLLRRIVLLLLAASMFGNHLQIFYGEVLTAVFVAVGLLCLVVGRSVPGYLLLVIGVVNTPAAMPALFLALLARPGERRFWRAVWPTTLTAGLVMVEFYVRRGSPFLSGYEGDIGHPNILASSPESGFSHPFVFGVVAILFSFGKGLALFVPGLWLLFKRPMSPTPETLQRFQRLSIWFLVGLIAVYAKWWAWNGAGFWGPRFFLFACFPACVALAIHLSDARATTGTKALTLAALIWSIWVAVDGVAIGLNGLGVCYVNEYYFEPLCWYTVEFSPLFRPFIAFPAVNPREAGVAIYYVLVGVVLAVPFAIDLTRTGLGALRRSLATGTPQV